MIRAKKKYGQNFLRDELVLDRIIQAIPKEIQGRARAGQLDFLELGPGLGDLTQKLVKVAKRTLAIEIDADLLPHLQDRFAGELAQGRLELVLADARVCEWGGRPYFLAANLPYYLATHLILRGLEEGLGGGLGSGLCEGMLVMVQREVAVKFTAQPGQADFGPLGILASLFGERELVFDVEPASFSPPPEVLSSLILLKRTTPPWPEPELTGFKDFLRICFAKPRKQFLNAFKTHKGELAALLAELGYPASVRPHELSVSNYLKIYEKGRKWMRN